MKKNKLSRIIALSLSAMLFCGCGAQTNDTVDLMDEAEISPIFEETRVSSGMATTLELQEANASSVSDFGLRLFRQSHQPGENMLISPLSVLYVLSMTANGAENNTLTQMEKTFGISVASLNEYLSSYTKQLPYDENNKLSMANSIWFRELEGFTVKDDFLQTNANYYDAEIFKTPFTKKTVKEINQWVKENTAEMIPQIITEIPEETVMYLINALAFDAKWQNTYTANQVRDGIFTKEDGITMDVELMYSKERHYLEDEKATGFIKYYRNHKYAFVALLPKEGVSVSDYISGMDGSQLQMLLSNPVEVQVNAAIPKFESEYETEMSKVLSAMGMPDAFDFKLADFSRLGTYDYGNIAINRVLHKTYIAVDEEGTKATAVTAVEMNVESAMMEPEDIKTVYLDRPFVYMLIDCENNLPIFIGTVMSVEK